jgi:hypothetical protein
MATGAQLRIIDLPGAAEQAAGANLPFSQSEVKFADQFRSDASLLKEMKSNRLLSEGFIASRGFVNAWNATEILLQALVPPVKWKGSNDQYRSNLGIPILAENFYSSHFTTMQTLFNGNRPFMVEPTASTSIEVAEAQEALLKAQMKTAGPKGTDIKLQFRRVDYEGKLYGTGVGIRGWETRKCRKIVRIRKGSITAVPINANGATADIHHDEDDIEEKVIEYETNHPVFEHVPLRRVRVAPDCRQGDIRSASWRGRLLYMDSYDLDSLRDVVGYYIPTREQLIALTTPQQIDRTMGNVLDSNALTSVPVQLPGSTMTKALPEYMSESSTVDPLAHKFEIFEYITDNVIGWCLENQYCIRNQNNNGDLEMYSFNFREAPDSFYGFGMGMWCGDFQRIAQGIINAYFDNLSLDLQGTFTTEKGLNNQSQTAWRFPGKVFKTDGPNGMKPMPPIDSLGNEPMAIVSQVKAWAANITGAGLRTQGANPGAPGDVRTGQGVEALGAGEMTKLSDTVDQICDLILVPFLEFCIENNRKLKPSQLRQMLTDELGTKFKADPIDVLNGSYKVTVSAGSKLQAEQALQKSFGYFQTLLQQPTLNDQLTTAATKIDYKAFIEGIMQNTGFPYQFQVIVPMTDEDKQRAAQQQNQIPQKLQADLAKNDAQTKGKIQIDDNQAENRALLKTQEHIFETSSKGFEQ